MAANCRNRKVVSP